MGFIVSSNYWSLIELGLTAMHICYSLLGYTASKRIAYLSQTLGTASKLTGGFSFNSIV